MGTGRAKYERDCGATTLEPAGRDKNSRFCEPTQWKQKETKGSIYSVTRI